MLVPVRSFRAAAIFFVLLPLLSSAKDPPPRVLFVGNSYTYSNNLPRLVAAIAEASGSPLRVSMLAKSGYSLDAHRVEGAAKQLRNVDVVVLQEHSRGAFEAPEQFLSAARDLARDSTAQKVLFVPWARSGHAADQLSIDAAYDAVAQALSARTARVGDAWQRALARKPDLILYAPDGTHPSALGSYLAALVLVEALTGKPAASPPARIRGHPVSDQGAVSRRVALLVDLAPAEVAFLQEVAAARE